MLIITEGENKLQQFGDSFQVGIFHGYMVEFQLGMYVHTLRDNALVFPLNFLTVPPSYICITVYIFPRNILFSCHHVPKLIQEDYM